MITLYGIKNCDTMQKALKWLEANNVPYHFHNYKEQGIDTGTLTEWLTHFAIDKLVNIRSTTYKDLGEEARKAIARADTAIALMMKYNSIIKRPVWDLGNGKMLLGWNENELRAALQT